MSTATDDAHPISVRSLVEAVRAEQSTRFNPTPSAAKPTIVAVQSAHPGAGGTTVSLALLDALASYDVHQRTLVDLDRSDRSGLVGAAEVETESDLAGWRRGLRAGGVILRPAHGHFGLPPQVSGLTILDSAGPASGAPTVTVCRATLPSLRAGDLRLRDVDHVAHLVVVGVRRWPKPVARLIPPRVADMYQDGRVSFMPHSSHLELFGIDSDPMPGDVVEAAARIAETLWPDLLRTAPRRTRKAVRR